MSFDAPIIPQHELRYQQLVTDVIPLIQARQPLNMTIAWIVRTVKLCSQYGFTQNELRRAISDLAWYERSLGSTLPSLTRLSSQLEKTQKPDPEIVLALYWYVSQRYRFDFQFHRIIDASNQWLPFGMDTQLDAILIFAYLGLDRPEADQLIDRLLSERARQLDSVAKDILLHGLWFGADKYFDQLIRLSDLMIANKEASENVYFRRAVALRLAGRYSEARASIIKAIELSGGGEIDIMQNYIDELELIRTFQVFSSRIAETISLFRAGTDAESEPLLLGNPKANLPTVEELLSLSREALKAPVRRLREV